MSYHKKCVKSTVKEYKRKETYSSNITSSRVAKGNFEVTVSGMSSTLEFLSSLNERIFTKDAQWSAKKGNNPQIDELA